MAIRKSRQEEIVVTGNREEWLSRCRDALERAGFTKISVDSTLFQIEGNYKKLSTWGSISLTLTPADTNTKVNATSTANVDNIFALFKSPSQTILQKFKDALS